MFEHLFYQFLRIKIVEKRSKIQQKGFDTMNKQKICLFIPEGHVIILKGHIRLRQGYRT